MATELVKKVYEDNFIEEGIDENESRFIIYSLNKKRAKLLTLLSGYAHDLGHTPFGHDGENAISEVYIEYQEKQSSEERRKVIEERREIFGRIYEESLGHKVDFNGISSFVHIEQSYINFLNIINRDGIKFSPELLEIVKFAILAHSRSRVESLPTHISKKDLLVVHAIRTADKGDYQIVDGAEIEKLMELKTFESEYADKSKSIYEKINFFIDSWAKDIKDTEELSDEMLSIFKLKQYRAIYDMWAILYCEINQVDINSIGEDVSVKEMLQDISKTPIGIVGMFKGNKARNKCIVKKLMKYYLDNYDEIPETYQQSDTEEAGHISEQGSTYEAFNKSYWEKIGYSKELIAIGFMTSLTNSEAKALYEKLVYLRIREGKGHGIEPIRHEEIDEINRKYTLDYIEKMYSGLIKGKKLSEDEKRGLEAKLRKTLLDNKSIINKSFKDKGLVVIGRARSLRIEEQLYDDELYSLMVEADSKRERGNSRLNYPNLFQHTDDGR